MNRQATTHRLELWLAIVFVLFWIAMAISPVDRKLWFIENLLPIAVFFLLLFTFRTYTFTKRSYLLLFVFLCIHLYAAHYKYDQTPIDVWLKAAFHLKRSYFDRVVHFAFGFLLLYPFRELLTRLLNLKGLWSYGLPLSCIMSLSALYEIVEMFAALFAGKLGMAYLGLQGDEFDTQKDMSLGLLGGLIASGILAIVNWRNKTK